VAEFRGNHTAHELAGYRKRYWLSSCAEQTPEAAMDWFLSRVWNTALQLDGRAQAHAWAWMRDPVAQQTALQRLESGRPVAFSVIDDHAVYEVFVQSMYGALPTRAVPAPVVGQRGSRRHAARRARSPVRGLRQLAKTLTLPAVVVAGAMVVLCSPR
jgi:hypothetical protein